MTYPRLFALSLLALVGCDEDKIDLDPLDETPPVEASVRPTPILGGTLTLIAESTAIATDPDRDLVHIVDLEAGRVLHTVELERGDQPHRVALGSDGLAHVVLRGAGGIATVDWRAGTITARHALCAEPRGIAYHAAQESLYVACAGGSLLRLSEAGEVQERRVLEPDLRDVVIVGDEVKVSLFRSAAILGLDGSRTDIPNVDGLVPHVAWRTWVTENGEIAILHQTASVDPVPINPDADELSDGSAPYGGGGGCEFGIVNAAVTVFTSEGIRSTPLLDSNLTVDAAFAPDSTMMALAVPGVVRPQDIVEVADRDNNRFGALDFPSQSASARPPLRIEDRFHSGCASSFDEGADPGQVTAVAFTGNGRLVVQSREPARLTVFAGAYGDEVIDTIDLVGEPRFDSGHEIFHRATDSGLSCASCHPEGTDDGHVWSFVGLGPRRTQALDVGLGDTAPYHWDGDMPDFDVLMSEVLAHRMGGKRQSTARGESFTRWMFAQQRPAADGADDLTLAAAGKQLFTDYACSKCHDGPAFGGQRTERIAGVDKQVPTLRRISLHPPFMHDGRSATLEAAIRDMIETTRETSAPDADVDAIAAYLRTL